MLADNISIDMPEKQEIYYIFIYMCVYTCICVCIYVYIHTCVYIYIYIYIKFPVFLWFIVKGLAHMVMEAGKFQRLQLASLETQES